MAAETAAMITAQEDEDPKLAAIQAAIVQSSEEIDNFIRTSKEGVVATAEASKVMTGAIMDNAMADQIIALQKDTADLNTQRTTIKASEAAGGLDAQIALMTTLGENAKRVQELTAKKEDIMDDQHTGIGIVDVIVNEFRSIQTDAELEAAAERQARTLNSIQNISAATESVSKQAAATAVTLSEGTIEANQKKVLALAQIQVSEQEIANARNNSAVAATLASAVSQKMDNALTAYRLDGDLEDRKVRRAQHNATVAALEKEQLTDMQLQQALRKGQARAGITPYSPEIVLERYKNPGTTDVQASMIAYLNLGLQDDALGVTLGSTPSEAVSTLRVTGAGADLLNTKGGAALSYVQNAINTGIENGTIVAPKTKEQFDILIDSVAASKFAEWETEIKDGDKENPLVAPAMSSLVLRPAVANTPLVRKVPQVAAMKEMNHQQLIDYTLAGVQSGLITMNEGIDSITTIFGQAALANNSEAGGLRKYGFPNQTSYVAKITMPQSMTQSVLNSTLGYMRDNALLTSGGILAAGLVTGGVGAIPLAAGAATVGFGPFAIPDSRTNQKFNLLDRSHVAYLFSRYMSTMPSKSTTGGAQ